MNPKSIRFVALFLSCAAAGCGPKTFTHYSFPPSWPGSLPPVPAADPLISAPELTVEPLSLDIEPAPYREVPAGSPPTAKVLTDLLIVKLREAGVNVVPDADYALIGVIPRLGYAQRLGYPRKIVYSAQLTYRLIHRPTGREIWKGDLD